ncbi:site-specific tyrosine recombinase XerD [Nocardia asteroides]|uniref:Tyrosine recombinase XerD n=1 Tax=Nocardia asteroides NBRC 15531 TaxID=1110697 RepID=U5EB69_NOCAS|nr:site-specific tyrosine recombinase XerD [Nocardia asteroides]TLF66509.1 site-specific tyrosine recombinase XerD [Nocardia asteroides NBRC 15531]UGT46397.1 site-specific tyrosine recombinase XerD [Nocardia asteroides]SFM92906.1 integrase/recombinase XerD [Nocardia asteroides]VEG34789.1 Tyrosine recombinase XerD [Nocardia asteroides]GAD82424.1 tyrosine recombinase XerD [Nocardia asteroides NBRC 15531]
MLAREIDAYLDHLTVERGAARNTLGAYRRDLARYRNFLDGRGIASLGAVAQGDVAEFTMALRAGGEDHPPLAAGSVARALIAVRGLHRFAAAEGITDTDVAHAVKPPAPGRRLPKALPYDQVLRLLEAAGGEGDAGGADGGPRGLRDRALLELLYSTGARISEMVGLDVDDIDAEQRCVVLRGKGGKQRLVPIGRPALAAVDAYLVRGRPTLAASGKGSAGALFLNARGGRLSRQSAWQVLQTAAERAGIGAAVSPHTLRHSFATHLLDGGADVRVVQELLGHASVTTTQIYTLVTVSTLREVWATAHPRAR